MTSEIVVALLALCGTLIGSIAGIMTANKLTTYRISELEKKVERHNQIIERVTLMERDNDTQWKRLDEFREDLEAVKHTVYGGTK